MVRIGPVSFFLLLGAMLTPLVGAARQRVRHPTDRSTETLFLQQKSPAATRLAHERYAFLKGIHDLDYMRVRGDYTGILYFPVGRADRAYFFVDNCGASNISCFQRKGGQYALVFAQEIECSKTVTARQLPVASPRRRGFTSLLNWLTDQGGYSVQLNDGTWVLHLITDRSFSKSERADLGIRRDYVEYCTNDQGVLFIELLSSPYSRFGSGGEWYSLSIDPFTHAKITEDEFYEKYGLPVTRKDLRALRSGRSAALRARRAGSAKYKPRAQK